MRRFGSFRPPISAAAVASLRFCSTAASGGGGGGGGGKPPAVLQRFDHLMRTVPAFRQLYPQLLTALVDGSRAEAIAATNKMVDIIAAEQKSSAQPPTPDTTGATAATAGATAAAAASAAAGTSAEPAPTKLSIILIDTAFADMFSSVAAVDEVDAQDEAVNELEEESADEQLLDLFMACCGADFKQQRARIAAFLLAAVQQERDAVIKERGLSVAAPAAGGGGSNAQRSIALPNVAITVTPPIAADNTVTATALLKRAREELGALQSHLGGGRDAVLRSMCRRLVFSGAVATDAQRKEVAELTQQLFDAQKNKPENLEKDLDQLRLVCQCTVESDFVNSGGGDAQPSSTTTTVRLLRYDVGFGDKFAESIGLVGLDAKIVLEVEEEIGRRVVQRMNSALQAAKPTTSAVEEGQQQQPGLEEHPILPFAFTMRCRIL